MKIGTYNIQHGRDHAHFLGSGIEHINLEALAHILRGEAPDVCGLNEVRNQENLPGLCHQSKVIAEALGYHHVFARAIDHSGGEYGNALISRYPIRSHRLFPISVPMEARQEGHKYEDRVLLVATLDVEGRPLTVMVCHFGLNSDEIALAVETIRRVRAELEGAVVLMGDFNLTSSTPHYRALCQILRDTAEDPALPLTFPSHAPQAKIDYVFVSEHLRTNRVCAPNTLQSDHLPYFVHAEWADEEKQENG